MRTLSITPCDTHQAGPPITLQLCLSFLCGHHLYHVVERLLPSLLETFESLLGVADGNLFKTLSQAVELFVREFIQGHAERSAILDEDVNSNMFWQM